MGLVIPFAARESAILGYHDEPAYNGAVRAPPRRGRRALPAARSPSTTSARATARCPRRPSPAATSRRSCWPASWSGDPDLLLVGQPTRGVDIGAIEFIHRRLLALRDAGKALLLVSVELDEILALADRILVMHDGRDRRRSRRGRGHRARDSAC